ncbi:Laminin IV type B domain-containing protein [Plasmodiophora brassicae]
MIVDPVTSARADGGWPAMDPAHRQQRAAAPANLVQLEQSVRKLAIQEPVFVPPPVEYRLPPQPPPRRMAPEDAPGIDTLLSSSSLLERLARQQMFQEMKRRNGAEDQQSRMDQMDVE